MFTIGTHNVTDIHKVRIIKGLDEGEGYLTLCFHSLPFYDGAEETSNEYTFYMKDLEKGFSSLMKSLDDAMWEYTKNQKAMQPNDG